MRDKYIPAYRPCRLCHRLFLIDQGKEAYHARTGFRRVEQWYCDKNCFELDWRRRFWSQVVPTDGCWTWTGGRNSNGYPMCWRPIQLGEGRQMLVSRLIFEIVHHQCVLPWIHVCHRCDNPGCVRPDHLFLGTAADNIADCRAKGRFYLGSRRRKQALTP